MADSNDMKPVLLALSMIKVDLGLQPRVALDIENHCEPMSRAYEAGIEPPPPIHVFLIDEVYYVVDGFHRVTALTAIRHLDQKFNHILAYVHHGTWTEALVFAAQANRNNRSKPLSIPDKKKALEMLLDDYEMRGKTVTFLARMVDLSRNCCSVAWVDYFTSRNIPLPDYLVREDGKKTPSSQNAVSKTIHSTGDDTPKPRRKNDARRKGYEFYRQTINGKMVALGTDLETAKQKLHDVVQGIQESVATYANPTSLIRKLAPRGVSAISAFGDDLSSRYHGFTGIIVGDIVAAFDVFEDGRGLPAAIGRVDYLARRHGYSRRIILCPVENVPSAIIDLGQRDGIEFMTIDQFVEFVKSQQSAPGASA